MTIQNLQNLPRTTALWQNGYKLHSNISIFLRTTFLVLHVVRYELNIDLSFPALKNGYTSKKNGCCYVIYILCQKTVVFARQHFAITSFGFWIVMSFLKFLSGNSESLNWCVCVCVCMCVCMWEREREREQLFYGIEGANAKSDYQLKVCWFRSVPNAMASFRSYILILTKGTLTTPFSQFIW